MERIRTANLLVRMSCHRLLSRESVRRNRSIVPVVVAVDVSVVVVKIAQLGLVVVGIVVGEHIGQTLAPIFFRFGQVQLLDEVVNCNCRGTEITI